MHFAYPPRKSSNPPPFRPRSSKLPQLRRRSAKTVVLILLVLTGLGWLVSKIITGIARSNTPAEVERPPLGDPPAVIVTVVDEAAYGRAHADGIRQNRQLYAEKHGYKTFIGKVGDYDLEGAPFTWNKVLAMRHAITQYPEASYIWYLEQDAYIMNPSLTIEEHIMTPDRLEELILRDRPLVPPNSIIKTLRYQKPEEVDLVISQDPDGLLTGSMIMRNGQWARYFLEMWYSPLYRSYNFLKAESHALEHIVQWHSTILAKLAIIPQDMIYTNIHAVDDNDDHEYTPGDFVVRAEECGKIGEERSCESELAAYKTTWQNAFKEEVS